MRKLAALVPSLVLASSTLAAAETTAPPAAAEPKLAAGVSLAFWLPEGDVDDFVDESLGVRPVFTYWIRPFVGVTASFDFIFVNEKDNVDSTTYYAISVGVRFTTPRPASIKPYGEFLVGQHQLENDIVDDGALGIRIGGGAAFALSDRLTLNAGITYSSASIDTGGFFELDVDAFVPEVGVAARF